MYYQIFPLTIPVRKGTFEDLAKQHINEKKKIKKLYLSASTTTTNQLQNKYALFYCIYWL